MPLEEADGLAAQAIRELDSVEDAEDVIEELLRRRLLAEFTHADGHGRVRSRFAESVRLFARLRQLLPDRPWQTAPTLVSDFRVDARPRRMPRRDVAARDALERLASQLHTPERRALAASLLSIPGGTGLPLAGFQVRAAQMLLGTVGANRGIVISAGTGSGKTLAFYLPALVEIGAWVETGVHWTKGLAIYPRRELLKDQFTEAYRLARRLDDQLREQRRRPITAGTLFGLTPIRADRSAVVQAGWLPLGEAFICPYLLCPVCDAEMVWRSLDIDQNVERLTCRRAPQCDGSTSDHQVVLTRALAQKQPPDLLFTTVEMLNQRLSDSYQRHLFGIHPNRNRRVRLALLDEVHTYEGTAGAHAALVLRRWRHAVGSPVRLVGLSATLREATNFFAQLTGLPARAISEVSPTEDEMREIATAYQLILRGDPVSQTSLLSTSIQATFLLQRILDSPVDDGGPSAGRFGRRTFVFTDDLDVTNRLFDDLRDAEGFNIFGRPKPGIQPLAALRATNLPDGPRRDVAGQRWRLSEEIGWSLQRPLRVSRTTSQDAGVAALSEVVVATSALEVGFNDTTVGAVLQHKSPRGMASFVQRRGRAGRTSDMRPWMVTVLSDYGRDRLIYQSYERLFDPTLDAHSLPTGNLYLLHMQAAFSFFDWLCLQHQDQGARGWWWRPLNGPAKSETDKAQQKALGLTLRSLVRGDAALLDSLSNHLAGSLGLNSEDVASVLWEPPRSLMLELIPTIARRLHTNWQTVGGAADGHNPETDILASPGSVHPMPDFVPGNLFSDLSLPDVTIQLPPATVRDEVRLEMMPIVAAMTQIAPGRVTRRFAFERGALSHWIPVPLSSGHHKLALSEFASESQYVGQVPVLDGMQIRRIPCYRPWTVAVEKVPPSVSATSNAALHWGSELLSVADGLNFPIQRAQGWESTVREVTFFLHTFHSPVTVRRFATGATANIRIRGTATEHHVETEFVDNSDGETQAALGLEQDVDAICVKVNLPSAAELAARAALSQELPGWRTAYLRERVLNDSDLALDANWFQRDWLFQVYFSAILSTAQRVEASTLEEAAKRLHSDDSTAAFEEVLAGIFQGGNISDDDEEESGESTDGGSAGPPARLRERLTDLLARPRVLKRLQALGRELWEPDLSGWGAWLAARAHETLAEAVLYACQQIAPQHVAIDTLLLDLQRLPGATLTDDGLGEIWVTESTLGGVGVVEAIARRFAADPHVLFRALEAAIAPTDLEAASLSLDRFMELAVNDTAVARHVADVRRQSDHGPRNRARAALYGELSARGVAIDHAFSSALNHRLLRYGSSPSLDQLLSDVLILWKSLEQQFRVAIDLRVFAYLASSDSSLGPRIREVVREVTGHAPSLNEMVGVLAGLLWPRPAEVRTRFFESYSPFRVRGYSDPSLIRELMNRQELQRVWLSGPTWESDAREALGSTAGVQLLAEIGSEATLSSAVLRLIATPVDLDFLQFFPVVEQVHRGQEYSSVTLLLREVV